VEVARTRREEYSEATRGALLDSAQGLFAERGFAATSLDEIAAEARVTKGAVYHHFANKQALFEAVADRIEDEACAAIMAAAAQAPDAWSGAVAGLDCFLGLCLDPLYGRVCFQEGPVVMGFTSWWEHGEKRELNLVRGMLLTLKQEGLVEPDDLDTLAQLLFGSMTAAALALAREEDPDEARARIREATIRLVAGLHPDALSPADRP
jgi:AcrR family transcriptional regulator